MPEIQREKPIKEKHFDFTIFESIGTEIDRRWSTLDYELSEFPRLAAGILDANHFETSFSDTELVRWISNCHSLPKQNDPESTFGEPPITVWSNERFVIDICCWLSVQTARHDHGFVGAFTTLCGESIEFIYEFVERCRPTPDLGLGDLTLSACSLLGTGQVREISPGRHLVHAVWHLSIPTITMVIRTIGGKDLMQYEYLDPGLAIRHTNNISLPVRRRNELLKYLFQVDHPRKHILATELLLGVSPWECLWQFRQLLILGLDFLNEWPDFESVRKSLVKKHGQWLREFLDGLTKAYEPTGVIFQNLTKPEHRYLLALLTSGLSREEIMRLITVRVPQRPWDETFAQWVAQIIRSGGFQLKRDKAIAALKRNENPDGNDLNGEVAGASCQSDILPPLTIQELSELRVLEPLLR